MKTPREVLLARHQTAGPKLDKIRREAVADLTPRSSRGSEIPFVLDCLPKLISEKPLTPSLSPSDGERILRDDSRVEPLNRSGGGGSGTGVPPVRSETHGRDARATTRFTERVAESRVRGFLVPLREFVLATVLKLWHEFILPRPQAWAAVAAMWVVIFVLKLSTPESTHVVVQKSSASAEVLAEVRQQKLLFAELVGVVKPRVAVPSKAAPPQPRSDRRLQIPIG